MKELLEYLARALVDEPDRVQVEEFEEDDGTLVLELSVGDDDYGQVIGRGGRTAQALRTVVKAAAVKDNRRVLVDIVEWALAIREDRTAWLEAGRVGRPHGLDGSFHVTRADAPARWPTATSCCSTGGR